MSCPWSATRSPEITLRGVDGAPGIGDASPRFASTRGVRQMAGRTPAAGGRLPLGKAVTQAGPGGRALALIGGLPCWSTRGRAAAGQVDARPVPARLGRDAAGPRLHRPLPGPDLAGPVGLCILGAGIVVLAWPGVTVTALLYILVVGGLCLASVDLVGAFVDRRRHLLVAAAAPRPGDAGPGGGAAGLAGETLAVVRLIAGAAAAVGRLHPRRGLPVAHPRRPRGYRGQLDKEIPHRLI